MYAFSFQNAEDPFDFDADPDPGSALKKWIRIQLSRFNAFLNEQKCSTFFSLFLFFFAENEPSDFRDYEAFYHRSFVNN